MNTNNKLVRNQCGISRPFTDLNNVNTPNKSKAISSTQNILSNPNIKLNKNSSP